MQGKIENCLPGQPVGLAASGWKYSKQNIINLFRVLAQKKFVIILLNNCWVSIYISKSSLINLVGNHPSKQLLWVWFWSSAKILFYLRFNSKGVVIYLSPIRASVIRPTETLVDQTRQPNGLAVQFLNKFGSSGSLESFSDLNGSIPIFSKNRVKPNCLPLYF